MGAGLATAQGLRGLPPGFSCGTTRGDLPKGTNCSASPGFFSLDQSKTQGQSRHLSERGRIAPGGRSIMPAGSPTMQQRRDPPERERVRHGEHVIEHLLRRAGFGASQDEIDDYLELGFPASVQQLLELRERSRRRRCADRQAGLRRRSPHAENSCRRPSSTTPASAGCSG